MISFLAMQAIASHAGHELLGCMELGAHLHEPIPLELPIWGLLAAVIVLAVLLHRTGRRATPLIAACDMAQMAFAMQPDGMTGQSSAAPPTGNAPSTTTATADSWWAHVATGIRIGLIGSPVLAVAETALPTYFAMRYFEPGWWPVGFVLGAVGKAAILHSIVWCPLLGLLGFFLWAWRRGRVAPEPALTAAAVLIVGLMIVPLDLDMAHLLRRGLVIGSCGATVVLAGAMYFLMRRLARRSPRGLRKWMQRFAGMGTAATLLTGYVFIRSPLASPGDYRAPLHAVAAPRTNDPHVLWILLDTVRADHLGLHGYPEATTPFLDAWSRQALVCDRAISDSMWTLPAHASMFTGLSVREHGVDFAFPFLDERFTTVAEALKQNGYQTACFSNNPWIWKHTNVVQGFDEKYVLYHTRNIGRFSLSYLFQRIGWVPPIGWLEQDYGAAVTNHYIAQWLASRVDAGDPLFLFVNYFDAHLPYSVPLSYRRMFMDERQVARSYELRYEFGNLTAALDYRYNIEGPDFLSEKDHVVLRRLYASGIRYLDDRVRELMQMFEARGMLENTLVVIASDHGEHLGEQGLWAHRYLTHEVLTRAVLMVREPGRTTGQRMETATALSDLYPTVLRHVLGDSAPAGGPEARDLLSPMASEGSPRVVISKYNGPAQEMLKRIGEPSTQEMAHRCAPQIAAHDGRYKLLLSDSGRRELYDVIADPGETRNVSGTMTDEAQRLETYIAQWRARTPKYVPPKEMNIPSEDPHTVRVLKSLGYLGGQ